jgi:hypothetical protein
MKFRKQMITALLIISLSALISCASDDEKAPSVEVNMANRAFDLSIGIKEAFLRKDGDALRRLCGKDLSDELVFVMEEFKGKDIDFKMRWVDIDEEGEMHLYIQWNKFMGDSARGEQISGLALFVLNRDFIAVEIMRENPFIN